MFFILGDFLPFYLASSPKSENFKTMKKTPRDVIILHKCTKNHDHMPICSWDIWHVTYIIVVFHFFGNFFPFTPNSPKTQNFKKMKRKPWRYCHFIYMYQKLWLDDVRFLRYGGWEVDGWKKWHIEMGAPPKIFITPKYQVMIYYKNFITSTLLDIGPKAFSERR